MACAPPTLNTRRTPQCRAVTSDAASTQPSGPGGVQTEIRGTPASTAGTLSIIITEGKEPFPRGTYNPAEAIGVMRSPEITPGDSSPTQAGTGICRSWWARTFETACSIAALS